VRNAQFGRHRRETKVGGPDLVTLQDRGGEKVHVDPAETSAKEASRTHKGDDLRMGDCVRLVHLLVSREKSAATAEVTNKKLAKDHGVPDHLVKAEKPIEFLAAGLVVAKKPYPNRGVSQDHHATLRLAEAFDFGPSRRRGTSKA
jgi:hypothetical protein